MRTILETRNIIKDFPGVRALDHISFKLEEGQIHALCGENGAGKSTLINVLSGVYPASTYEGDLLIFNQKVNFQNISDAIAKGIGVIHQEISLFNELSVMENLFVGHEISNHGVVEKNEMFVQTRNWLDKIKMTDVEPDTRLGDLGVGKKQLVEIARVLRLSDVKILILDEPTAALTEAETEVLLEILNELKTNGMSIIYISHKLDEVMRIADYVSILRDGKSIGGAPISELTEVDIVRMMVGRDLTDMYPIRNNKRMDIVLKVEDFCVREHFTDKTIVQNASFELRKGEILGLFGLLGAGRTELVSSIYGDREYKHSGTVILEGKKLDITSPGEAIKNGIIYCTEDRKKFGIIPTMDIRENITIAHIDMFKQGFTVNVQKEAISSKQKVENFNIKTPSLATKIINLSGGNQQKVLLSRSLLGNTKVLILDEPTRGIDVGAKQEIYSIISKLVDKGLSIIWVSSELPEILGLCDRVIVMHRSQITAILDNEETKLTEEAVMTKATGLRS